MYKANMKHFLTLLIAVLLLLPSTMKGADKKMVTSIDLTMPVPQPDMTMQEGEQLQLTAAKTQYGDLVEKRIASIMNIVWEGEFNTKDPSNPKFKAGYTYRASIKLMLDTKGPYLLKYEMRHGDYYVDDTMVKISVNGVPARVMISGPYFPTISAVLTVPGGKGGNLKKEDLFEDYNANKKKYRASHNIYSKETADACCANLHPHDVVTITETHNPLPQFEGPNRVFLTKVIVDTGNEEDYKRFADDLSRYQTGYYNLKEVWLSDKVNAVTFMRTLNDGMKNPIWPDSYYYYYHSTMFLAGDATLCVPAKQGEAVRTLMARHAKFPPYTVRTYTGNVADAQKAGLKATKNPCTKHNFVAKIMTADRQVQYYTCKQDPKVYYSCSICGQCERNPKHTFQLSEKEKEESFLSGVHFFEANLATDQAYVGTNAAGEHIYWQSCIWCGMSSNYEQRHLTEQHRRAAGFGGTLPLFRKHMEAQLNMREDDAKLSTTPQPDMFTLPARSTAKKSVWAEDEVNRALVDNLVDEQLLGNDYTVTATRQQVASIALKLIKEMTEKDADEDKLNLFADIADGKPDMTATVTRQEMATLIYRAMRYIEQNSKYTYTDYNSNLAVYTDSPQLKEWAKEPMAFMEALELIDPVTKTTLAPNAPCSIELALATAERATMAQHTGWAQTVSDGGIEPFITNHTRHDALSISPHNVGPIGSTLGFYERVWVYRMKGNNGSTEVKDKYTGQHLYFESKFLHPVRWRGPSFSNTKQKAKNVRSKASKATKKNNTLKKGLGVLKSILM